jgi:hypothetical protein
MRRANGRCPPLWIVGHFPHGRRVHHSIRRYRCADGIRATGSAVQIAIVDAFRDNSYAQAPARSIGRGGGLRARIGELRAAARVTASR